MWLAWLLVACTAPPDASPEREDTAAPSSPTTGSTTVPPTWLKTGEEGQLVYAHQALGGDLPEAHQLAAIFGADLQALPFATLCALEGAWCWRDLPAPGEEQLDPTPATLDPDLAAFTWVGDELLVDDLAVPFAYDPASGVAGYALDVAGFPAGEALDVAMDGEWGVAHLPGALVVPAPMVLDDVDPVRFLNLAQAGPTTFSWADEGGLVFVDVTRPDGLHELHGAEDGTFAWDAGPWLPLEPGEFVVFDFLRWTPSEVDVHGNTLTTAGLARVRVNAGTADPQTCLGWQQLDPSAPSGTYDVQPDPTLEPVAVWCDMAVDGGGWTLVASSFGEPLDDAAGPWHPELAGPSPSGVHPKIWDGLRELAIGGADVRFVCRADPAGEPTVDLSFRDVGWYRAFTLGADGDSCFAEDDGYAANYPPERRNNLTGEERAAGDAWDAGEFEGEDSCGAEDDFTVDFDDRGMDSDQSDGTDWGEDDGAPKCGTSGTFGASWQLFVREG